MHALIVMSIVGIISIGWSCLNRERTPYRTTVRDGAISPEKFSAAIVSAIGVGILGIGMYLAVAGDTMVGLGCVAAGGLLTLFMGPSLTHAHDLCWTDIDVQGPSQMFGPGLGLSRTSIGWHDIVTVGTTITSYWFIQSNDGRRIYCSYLYPGYGSFAKRLRTKRPDLMLPFGLR